MTSTKLSVVDYKGGLGLYPDLPLDQLASKEEIFIQP
jgi:hypothetical protein